jgi:hypothetical protein
MERRKRTNDPKSAAPTPSPHAVPLNPFASCSKGDWCAYEIEARHSTTRTASALLVQVDELTPAEVGFVSRLRTGDPAAVHETRATISRAVAPGVLELLALPLGSPAREGDPVVILELESKDDSISFRDAPLACKKVSFRIHERGTDVRTVLWMAPSIAAPGIVRLETTTSRRDVELGTSRQNLVGMRFAKEQWGTRPEGL